MKCRYGQSPVASLAGTGGAGRTDDAQNVRKHRTWRDDLDRVLLLLGCLALAVLVVFVVIAVVSSIGGKDAGDTCTELEAWYEENPGDSNVSIAKDYYRLCDDLPPPVINGELSMDDVS